MSAKLFETQEASRAEYHFRFRLAGAGAPGAERWITGSVCIDGPYENKRNQRDEAACTVFLDTYTYPANIDLAWQDEERSAAALRNSGMDAFTVGASVDEGSHLTALAQAAVARIVKLLSHHSDGGYIAVQVVRQRDGLSPGEYYPRVWRPCFPQFGRGHSLDHERADARLALRRLESLLSDLFMVVTPHSEGNHSAFGHRIREFLLLSCTEVENAWRAILSANGDSRERFTTTDYVRLASPLELEKWTVRLADYPSLSAQTPFFGWDVALPTQSLSWYDAYNRAKHDRTAAFERATLKAAIESMAAVIVMFGVQFGPEWVDETSQLFGVIADPVSGDASSGYLAPKILKEGEFRAINLPLERS